MKQRKTIDLNSILMGANLLFAVLFAVIFSNSGGNEYIDGNTVVLGILLAVQTHIA